MHHCFTKVQLTKSKDAHRLQSWQEIIGKNYLSAKCNFKINEGFPTLYISGKLGDKNLFSSKTVLDLGLHISEIISYTES